jgi:hypothetical protein
MKIHLTATIPSGEGKCIEFNGIFVRYNRPIRLFSNDTFLARDAMQLAGKRNGVLRVVTCDENNQFYALKLFVKGGVLKAR